MLASSYEFRCARFSHVRKKDNVPSCILAKQALCIDDFIAWIEDNHCFVEQALFQDVSIAFS